MLFLKYKSLKEINVNINHYLIDWNSSPSKEQQVLQDFLRPFWKNKIVLAEFRIPGSLFRVDILNVTDKIAVEYSPSSTHDYNKHFHGNRIKFLKRVTSDINKILWLEKNGFHVIEVVKDDLKVLSRDLFLQKFEINL